MKSPPPDPSYSLLETLLAGYLEAEAAGQAPSRAALVAQHPEHAAELQAFWEGHDKLRQTAGHAIPSAGDPSSKLPATAERTLDFVSSETDRPNHSPNLAGTLALGEKVLFGDYELLEEIARGGMGVVYKARQRKLNRIVALKMILSGQLASRDDVRRFYTEAEAAANLEHVGIVPIYEVGEHQGQHFFSMGYIEGKSLAERIAQGPLSPREAAELLKQIAEAVAYAHGQGVIHRDLKPANILLASQEGRRGKEGGGSAGSNAKSGLVAKITDFGLAKRLDGGSDLTTTGQILGTPSYMPPEQAAGKVHEVKETADIYSLGAILYALLTGRPPFQAESPLDVLVQVLESEPTRPTKLNRNIPRELEWICLRCLDKQPAQRYATAQELAQDLDRFLQGESVQAQPAGLLQVIRRWARNEPSLAAHLAGILLALVTAQVRFAFDHADVPYHLRVTGVLLLWIAVSVLCQQLLNRERLADLGRYVWGACDVLLLTGLLLCIAPPRGPLLIGYPLLIAAVGLFFRVRLVVVTTAMILLAFPTLLLLSRDEVIPIHYVAFFELVLGILGFIIAYQVRRVRLLSQYYDHQI